MKPPSTSTQTRSTRAGSSAKPALRPPTKGTSKSTQGASFSQSLSVEVEPASVHGDTGHDLASVQLLATPSVDASTCIHPITTHTMTTAHTQSTRQHAIQSGLTVLDKLAHLQRDLLNQNDLMKSLTQLKEHTQNLPYHLDPVLQNVVDAIRVRAYVEHAKYIKS